MSWRESFEVSFYVAVSAGMAMGTASFLILAGAFELAGPGLVMVGVLVAMVLCMLVSSAIAEVASMYPSAPGVRTYIKQAYGDGPSLFFVFLYLLFVGLAAGAESYMFACVVHGVFPVLPVLGSSLVMVVLVAAVNLMGIGTSRGTQIATTVLLGLATLALGIAALGAEASRQPALALGDVVAELHALPAVAGMCVFLVVGFEWVTPLGFGPGAYQRKIPRAMPAGIGFNAVLYLVFVLGAAHVLPRASLAATMTPQLTVGELVAGGAGAVFVLGLCVVATASTFNAGILGGSRLIYALARERRLPAMFADFSLARQVPRGGILLLAGMTLVSTLVVGLGELYLEAALIASALVCFVYGAMLMSARRLRATQARRKRAFVSRVGRTGMLALAVLCVGLGLASLAGDPKQVGTLVAGTAACVLAAWGLARWSLAHAALAVPAGGGPGQVRETVDGVSEP